MTTHRRGAAAPEPPFVDLAGFGELTHLTRETLRTYKDDGLLPAPDIKLGKTHGWRPTTVRAWAKDRTLRVGPPPAAPDPVYLDQAAAAARIGVTTATFRHYRAKQMLPPPDLELGNSAGWTEATLDAWHTARPGPGRRPYKETTT